MTYGQGPSNPTTQGDIDPVGRGLRGKTCQSRFRPGHLPAGHGWLILTGETLIVAGACHSCHHRSRRDRPGPSPRQPFASRAVTTPPSGAIAGLAHEDEPSLVAQATEWPLGPTSRGVQCPCQVHDVDPPVAAVGRGEDEPAKALPPAQVAGGIQGASVLVGLGHGIVPQDRGRRRQVAAVGLVPVEDQTIRRSRSVESVEQPGVARRVRGAVGAERGARRDVAFQMCRPTATGHRGSRRRLRREARRCHRDGGPLGSRRRRRLGQPRRGAGGQPLGGDQS